MVSWRPFVLAWGCVLLVALPMPAASSEPEAGEPGFETVTSGQDPFLGQLPPPPPAVRLWAQMSSQGDAYFTLEKDVLPGPYTPAPMERRDPLLSFEVFPHVTTGHDGGRLQYAAREVRAAWDAPFIEDRPVVVEWRMSTGLRGLEPNGPAPMLLVSTRLVAESEDGAQRVLAKRTVRAALPEASGGTTVHVEMAPRDAIREGDRLFVHLDWSWAHPPLVGVLRQPAVSVHPGSWIDLPLVEPVRVVALRERALAHGLFVQAKVAHLFAIENVDLQNTNLLVQGPGVNVQGGRPLVQALRDGAEKGHAAAFDWKVPLDQARLGSGEYRFYVTAAQVGEDGPRVVAKRGMAVAAVTDEVEEPAAQVPALLAPGLLALAATVAWAVSRRR